MKTVGNHVTKQVEPQVKLCVINVIKLFFLSTFPFSNRLVKRVNFHRFHHQSTIINIAFHRNHFPMGNLFSTEKGAEVTRDKILCGQKCPKALVVDGKIQIQLFVVREVLHNESLTDGGF